MQVGKIIKISDISIEIILSSTNIKIGDILEEKLLRLWEWQNRRFIPKETV
jgi:hypothetical protein